jgi:hypothetical protein
LLEACNCGHVSVAQSHSRTSSGSAGLLAAPLPRCAAAPQSHARTTQVSRLSAIPAASLARLLALSGAMTRMSAHLCSHVGVGVGGPCAAHATSAGHQSKRPALQLAPVPGARFSEMHVAMHLVVSLTHALLECSFVCDCSVLELCSSVHRCSLLPGARCLSLRCRRGGS